MEGESGNSITWSPSDDHPESFTIYQNGTVIASGPWDGSPITVEVDGLSPGVYNYTLVVTDVGGNTVTDTVLIAVRDVGGTILILVLFGAGIAVVMIVVVIILRKRKT